MGPNPGDGKNNEHTSSAYKFQPSEDRTQKISGRQGKAFSILILDLRSFPWVFLNSILSIDSTTIVLWANRCWVLYYMRA